MPSMILPPYRAMVCHVSMAAPYAFASGSPALYDNNRIDPMGLHSTTTNKDRILIPAGVRYARLSVQLSFDATLTTSTDTDLHFGSDVSTIGAEYMDVRNYIGAATRFKASSLLIPTAGLLYFKTEMSASGSANYSGDCFFQAEFLP